MPCLVIHFAIGSFILALVEFFFPGTAKKLAACPLRWLKKNACRRPASLAALRVLKQVSLARKPGVTPAAVPALAEFAFGSTLLASFFFLSLACRVVLLSLLVVL